MFMHLPQISSLTGTNPVSPSQKRPEKRIIIPIHQLLAIYQYTHLSGESHALLDLRNGQSGVQSLRARPRAVQDGVASVQAHAVVEGVLALGGLLVTRIVDPSVGLEEHGWSEVLLGVPPVGWAGCAAASAENALVEAVELAAVGDGLTVFLAL
jgi:hypothetical protein